MMYIDSQSTDANFNFALERYAMEELSAAKEYFLFWRTSPTLMIGRFQNTLAEINMPFAKQNDINIVRRITGGGTIYTDMNGWQFSFIVRDPAGRDTAFKTFTQPILAALHSLGVAAEFSGRNDLVIDRRKFSGNAQFKSKDVVLHHGSLLFDTDLERLVRALSVDDEKIVAKGIQSVRQRVTNIADHMDNKKDSLAFRDVMLKYLLDGADTYTLTDTDIARINEIKAEQFDSWEWNFGADPKFNITKENRFAGGKLMVRAFVENGRIADIHFYGDFFAKEGLADLQASLVGCAYEESAIKNALLMGNAQDCFYKITLDEILSCII